MASDNLLLSAPGTKAGKLLARDGRVTAHQDDVTAIKTFGMDEALGKHLAQRLIGRFHVFAVLRASAARRMFGTMASRKTNGSKAENPGVAGANLGTSIPSAWKCFRLEVVRPHLASWSDRCRALDRCYHAPGRKG